MLSAQAISVCRFPAWFIAQNTCSAKHPPIRLSCAGVFLPYRRTAVELSRLSKLVDYTDLPCAGGTPYFGFSPYLPQPPQTGLPANPPPQPAGLPRKASSGMPEAPKAFSFCSFPYPHRIYAKPLSEPRAPRTRAFRLRCPLAAIAMSAFYLLGNKASVNTILRCPRSSVYFPSGPICMITVNTLVRLMQSTE